MQTSSFNLVQTASVLRQRWKTILLFVIASTVIASVTVFIVPPYFRSAAIITPGNPALADKGRIFNQHINDLYSYFGTGDDLDRIQGIADRDLTYGMLVDEFSLVDYYGLKGDSLPVLRKKAVRCLQKNITLEKTEKGQLQIIAWTKDKKLSAGLVNRMIAIVQQTAAEIWQQNYAIQIGSFDSTLLVMHTDYILLSDSASHTTGSTSHLASLQMQQLDERIQNFSRLKDEFKLAAQSLPPVLYVLEPALPAAYAERPDKPAVIIAAALLALVFSGIVVLVNDRKNSA